MRRVLLFLTANSTGSAKLKSYYDAKNCPIRDLKQSTADDIIKPRESEESVMVKTARTGTAQNDSDSEYDDDDGYSSSSSSDGVQGSTTQSSKAGRRKPTKKWLKLTQALSRRTTREEWKEEERPEDLYDEDARQGKQKYCATTM